MSINLEIRRDPETDKLSITKFTSENLVYTTFSKNDQSSLDAFSKLAPSISQAIIDKWTERADSGLPIRAFIVSEKESTEPLGYVNLGVNSVKIQEKTLLEGVFSFPTETTFGSEVLDSVYIDYASSLHQAGTLQEPAFIYTISPENTQKVYLEGSSLKKLVYGTEELQDNCLYNAMIATNRFSFDSENNIMLESGSPKDVYYTFYDDSVCNAGDTNTAPTDEL